jgi:hypothetical protein
MKTYRESELISDGDSVVCKCGNTTQESGFFPCDESGKEVEPEKEVWKKELYVCDSCRAIIDFSECDRTWMGATK